VLRSSLLRCAARNLVATPIAQFGGHDLTCGPGLRTRRILAFPHVVADYKGERQHVSVHILPLTAAAPDDRLGGASGVRPPILFQTTRQRSLRSTPENDMLVMCPTFVETQLEEYTDTRC